MIPFFTGFAVIVWMLAAFYRRRWQSFASILLAMLFMAGLIRFHSYMGEVTEGRIYTPVLRHVLIGYACFVGVTGLFLACIPRAFPRGCCQGCGYDLAGLHHLRMCPECATSVRESLARAARRHGPTGEPPAPPPRAPESPAAGPR
ncbi:MAG: hypothetical protein IT439_05125 [Phycisphaerales bacterium]|nr:hypothetical protein [Phycisphaerales bacterium]